MHTDARTLENGTLLEGDLCIIGAGAAGISMALEWIGTPYKVLLLEGGGFDYEMEVQDLYRGDITGQRYFPLETARLHYFGGTTGHWAGFCSTLDPIDLEKRDWVPYSGWPLRREDLDPFYERAQPILDLGPYAYDAAYWEAQDPAVVRFPLDESRVWTKMWQFSPPTRFGVKYRDAIVNAPNVHLYTYANVTGIEANEPVTAVEGLQVKTLSGKEHRVRARYYVLACCAIQNARLLLASNGQAPQGLGNDHDLVGRYFMEHPEVPSARLVLAEPRPTKMYAFQFFETKARGELAISAEAQRSHRILNCTASLWPGAPEGVPDRITSFSQNASRFRTQERPGGEEAAEPIPSEAAAQRVFTLNTRLEQAPNPASRVVLSAEKDALGVPRANLDWRLTPLDKRSVRTTYEIIAQEMGRTGLGRVQLMDWLLKADDAPWPTSLAGGWHHMGTTRMHEDPKQGVVDANGRVHGLGNLYVAGSAVYPTAGAANPTLTLVALTLRLSDHVKAKIA